MKYLKLFENFDSEDIFKDYFKRPEGVTTDFDLEYIKYAKKLSKVKKTDPKYALQIKAKNVMTQGIISIPRGEFLITNDFKFGKFLFKKGASVNSDGLGNLIVNTNGKIDKIKAIGPKRGFEKVYLNFYINSKRKTESPFTELEAELILFMYNNNFEASNEDINRIIKTIPPNEKRQRDVFIYELNKKFRENKLGVGNLIITPTGMKGSPKGLVKEFNYKLNPDYLGSILDIV